MFQVFDTVTMCLGFGQSVDHTRVPGSSGTPVVHAAVAQIQQSGVFPDDHSLLRRIAYVESRDGTHPDTYRAGYHGGIWQVDLIGFMDTQDTASHPGLHAKYQKIQEHFGIDWPTVQWMDLRKPLFSALAARLLLSNKSPSIPRASNLSGQAEYWKLHYNTQSGKGTVKNFIDDVKALEQIEGQLLQYKNNNIYYREVR